jgi:hypothetical protein
MTPAAFRIEMGMTGAPALWAILNAPFLNLPSLPLRDRVPSGYVHRLTPSCVVHSIVVTLHRDW